MLDVRDLSVSYAGSTPALDGVTLTVESGEIVALSGEPGAGKTALVRVLAGDLAPKTGSILIDGRITNERTRAAGAIAVVREDVVLCDQLDVAANLMLGRESSMRSEARFYSQARRELRRLGIPIRDVTTEVGRLSLGQRRLLALAMAMGRAENVLIVDELTASLGTVATATVERLLLQARDDGLAVLLVTRDIEQMFRIADRIVGMAHGRVVARMNPLTSHRDDIAALLGEEAAIAHREAAALRRSQDLQRQFLSRLSHELRTPLTAIRGYATSLSAPDVTWDQESQQRFLSRIAAESGRLGRLVDDLLDFSAIESGVMRLQPDWCELKLVIEAAVALLPADLEPSVEISCDAETPPVWADHDRLEQVFVNLLINAFRHNPPGVHVTVAARQLSPLSVEVTVTDDGSGFPAELSEHPFDTSGRTRSQTAGAGLGLSIARGILEAHDGTMELSSGPDGSRFRIVLPLETADLEPEDIAGEVSTGV